MYKHKSHKMLKFGKLCDKIFSTSFVWMGVDDPRVCHDAAVQNDPLSQWAQRFRFPVPTTSATDESSVYQGTLHKSRF